MIQRKSTRMAMQKNVNRFIKLTWSPAQLGEFLTFFLLLLLDLLLTCFLLTSAKPIQFSRVVCHQKRAQSRIASPLWWARPQPFWKWSMLFATSSHSAKIPGPAVSTPNSFYNSHSTLLISLSLSLYMFLRAFIETQEPYAIAVLLQYDLVLIDLLTPGFPCFESPYPMDLHESPVTCCTYLTDCPSDLVPAFYSVSSSIWLASDLLNISNAQTTFAKSTIKVLLASSFGFRL